DGRRGAPNGPGGCLASRRSRRPRRIVGMAGSTAGSAVPVGRARTLAQVYRHFGEVDAAGTSPLYERIAVALSESGEALRAIEAAPARERRPEVILTALHDL